MKPSLSRDRTVKPYPVYPLSQEMTPKTQKGWAFGAGRPRPLRLPVEEEIVIDVRWDDGRVTVHGSPWDLDAFAAGYLVCEGLVPSYREIHTVKVRKGTEGPTRVDVRLRRPRAPASPRRDNVVMGGPSATRPMTSSASRTPVRAQDLLALAEALHRKERGLRAAGHLHWAALYDPADGALILASDISRHSAVDKVVGKALLAGESPAGRILYTTGRIGEEMTAKAVRVGTAALATRSVAFGPAVRLAKRARLVLVGRLHPGGFWTYAGKARIVPRSEGSGR